MATTASRSSLLMTNNANDHNDKELIRKLLRVLGMSCEELELQPTNDNDNDKMLHLKTLVWLVDDNFLLVTATVANKRVDEVRLAYRRI